MRRNNQFIAIMALLALCLPLVSAEEICIDNTAPTAPERLVITESPFDPDGRVTLQWDASEDLPGGSGCPGVDHYDVFMKAGETTEYVKVGEALESPYLKEGLVQGVTYTFRVRAVDSVKPTPHKSDYSNEASTTIGQGPTCGDGLCNGDETCSTCEDDCGRCSSGGGSGGGSSGGSSGAASMSVNVDEDDDEESPVIVEDDQPLVDDSSNTPSQKSSTLVTNDDADDDDDVFLESGADNKVTGAVTGGGTSAWGWLLLALLLVAGLLIAGVAARKLISK